MTPIKEFTNKRPADELALNTVLELNRVHPPFLIDVHVLVEFENLRFFHIWSNKHIKSQELE